MTLSKKSVHGLMHTKANCVCLMLLCSLLLSACLCIRSADAAEPVYTMTQTELQQQKQNLSELRKTIVSNQNELQMLRQQLAISQTQLTQVEEQLEAQKLISQQLMLQLEELKKANQEQYSSLMNANELLQQSRAEEHRKLNKAKRNTIGGTIGGVIGGYILSSLIKNKNI